MDLRLKEEFMKIQYYSEYASKARCFKGLDFKDPDIRNHMNMMQVNDFKRGIYSAPLKPFEEHLDEENI